jgi:hypothetical protein
MYTLQGKTWPRHHTLSTLNPHMVQDHTYLTWSTYSNPSRSHQQSWAGPLLLRKRASDTIHSTRDWPIYESIPSFSPEPTNEVVGAKPSICWRWRLGLLGPYHWHVIGTFNIGSWGPTHRSLTDTGGCYNLGGAGLPHTTPWPSQPAISTFPKGPARSRV